MALLPLSKETNVLQTHVTAPEHILQVAYAFWQSKALFAAVEFDVFTALAEGPLEFETLISRTGLHRRGGPDFFDSLVALRLLDRAADGRYCNTPESDLYLVRDKPTYIGGLLRHLNARHYKNWDFLARALTTGEPQSVLGTGSYLGLYADECSQELFLEGMTAGSLLAARTLARNFPWSRYRTMVDIGTAQGCVPVEIASIHPHLTGGGFDLPQVETAFTSYVRERGLGSRLQFFPGDFFVDPLPQADVLVMGRILHNWDLSTRQNLLRNAFHALPEGGAVIVYDPMIGHERCAEPHGLLSSLNMLVETTGGSEYTAAECKDWIQQVGFRQIRSESLGDMHTAVIGFKPEPNKSI